MSATHEIRRASPVPSLAVALGRADTEPHPDNIPELAPDEEGMGEPALRP